jgi:hypothetical protein
MPRSVITINNPVFKLADTEAALTGGTAYECQLTSASITPVPTSQTIPSTGCSPASTSPGRTGFTLDLAWLQDWTKPSGGLSGYAYLNDTELAWFSLQLDSDDATVLAKGQVFVVAGAYGGTFGDGSAAAAAATWPCLDKPVITVPA